MITKLYHDYFQKSRAFIFPLVNISKKAEFKPAMTYMSWQGLYAPKDHRLIVTYNVDVTNERWKNFLQIVILRNPFFEDYSHTEDSQTAVVVFNLDQRKDAYDCVVWGKYSKINTDMRSLIISYYGLKTGEGAYMETFLAPAKHIPVYAEFLGVDEERLLLIGELCNAPDMDKECLELVTQRNFIEKVL